jgi:hypothetical protein
MSETRYDSEELMPVHPGAGEKTMRFNSLNGKIGTDAAQRERQGSTDDVLFSEQFRLHFCDFRPSLSKMNAPLPLLDCSLREGT